MLPKNPFNSTYSEMIDSNDTFLSLFDVSFMKYVHKDEGPFIYEDMFWLTVFFSSALGGGKSSMLHFFSPAVLDTVLQSRDTYREHYNFLKGLNVLDEQKIKLLSIYISCARNYEIIDDIYENGKRKVAFFALMNVRILKEALKSILTLKHISTQDLDSITFSMIPSELNAVFQPDWTGQNFYEWAIKEENRICQALNSMDDTASFSFIHGYLSVIQLFEADNVLFNGERIVDKVLFLFDDIHRLTKYQREQLRQSLFTVRVKVGVWLAQRTYGLDDKEVLGLDGTYGREYITRRFDADNQQRLFSDTVLQQIADKRVMVAQGITAHSFQTCIDDVINWDGDNKFYKILEKVREKLEETLKPYAALADVLIGLNQGKELLEQVINLRIVKILVDRISTKQQMFLAPLFVTFSNKEISKAIDNQALRSVALYYISIENSLPFYYGFDKLLQLASNNVFQFLSFAGAIFERRLSYQYRAQKGYIKVTAAEQDRIVRNLAKRKWDELKTAFIDAAKIMDLLSNIAYIGVKTRMQGTASYAGGAYTGIGIREVDFNALMNKDEKLRSLAGQCVSNNLLIKQAIKQGKKDELYIVLYLNRWVCVHFGLPLAYGGWKSCNKELFQRIFTKDAMEFAECYDGGKQREKAGSKTSY